MKVHSVAFAATLLTSTIARAQPAATNPPSAIVASPTVTPWGQAPPSSTPPVQNSNLASSSPRVSMEATAIMTPVDRGARVLFESLGGLGMGLAGGLLGGLGGLAIAPKDTSDVPNSLAFVAAGAGLGFLFSVPLGVTLVGTGRRGNGGYGWSLFGTLSGAALSVGSFSLYSVASRASGSGPSSGVISLLSFLSVGLMVGGGVAGYELSCTRGAPEGPLETLRRPRLRVVPTLSLTDTSGSVGIAGAF